MSKNTVVSFAKKKAEAQFEAEFLDLLDHDIRSLPQSIQPVPTGLVARIRALRQQADDNRRRDPLEG
ncbi:hypothetical protein [Pseudomonas japonica]|uniref:hypothetical protein n=1 Tax=Pseudomonas japonica TaxID=256466 RepID=UPI0015E478CF|nr:hypothetical protein [Pseudomonas japonica]MBA1243786.1 hypothetical protein [Pseudomonas japonica]MBA1287254.1 hypothetical protein [Pseudomonas japonica]